jgi:hypothetical protein
MGAVVRISKKQVRNFKPAPKAVLTNYKTCTESRIKIFLPLTISVIDQFSLEITSHWTAEKSA